MNEAPRPLRAGHRGRLAKTLGTLAAVALLAAVAFACSIPSLGTKSASLDSRCADKVIKALTSTSVVPGSYACLDSAKQARAPGITSDADIAALAVSADVAPCGAMKPADSTHNQRYYTLSITGITGAAIVQIITDRTDGRVAFVYVTQLTKCP